MKKGVVVKSTGKYYDIREDTDQNIVRGIVRGKFKLKGFKLTNPVAVGDRVGYEMEGELAVIKHIDDRTNYVIRQSPRKKHHLHILASNIDQAILIVTIVEPNLKQGFIDRFLLLTETYQIPVLIVFNKADLYTSREMNMYDYLQSIYETIGYRVLLVSTVNHVGVSELSSFVRHKTSLIAGQSGVGKSTIINILKPQLGLKTQVLSGYSGKGQHTTTFAELFSLDEGGELIDTPGIKALGFNHLEVQDVAHNFKEFFEASKDCKFADCTHRNEPQCEVKDRIEKGEISELRYYNYLQILEDIENQNYWERIKDY